jgi:hypothetical protein
MYPDKEIYAELYYLRSGHRRGHTFTDNDIENVISKILAIGNKIINDFNFTQTSNERACRMCDHAISKVCTTGVNRLRKMNR